MQTDSDTSQQLESDTSSINDSAMLTCPQLSRDHLEKEIKSLALENKALRTEINTFKLRVNTLQEENRELRKKSVNIQVSTSN